MADNVSIKDYNNAAAVVATDEVIDATLGTVQVQFVKLMDGTLNGNSKLSIDSTGSLQANIAAISTSLPAGSNTIGKVDVNGTVPVSGTFWQATQPVSLAANVNVQGTVNVGNFPATQAVSGNVSISQMPALSAGSATIGAVNVNGTVPVSGTFWQATQPVSLASNVSVQGTVNVGNFPATQTVSLSGNASVQGTVNIGNFPGTQAVSGNVSITQMPALSAGSALIGNVSVSQLPTLPAGSNLLGKVGLDQTTPGTTNAVSLAQIGTTTVVTGGVNGTLGVGGTTAAGSTSAGNPVRIGAKAATTNPTAVADGQVSNILTDKIGRQVVVQGHVRDLVGAQATTITNSTSPATCITAAGAGVYTDITSLTVTNGNATPTTVTISDGTASYVFNLAGGGGFTIPFNPPLPATTTNTNWTLACGTAVSSVYASIVYIKNI